MFKMLVSITLFLFPMAASSGDLTGKRVLGELRIGAGVVRISAGSESWNDPDNCTGNNSGVVSRLYLAESNSNWEEIYSAILVARVSKTSVQFYVSGCHTVNNRTYPLISTMYL